VVGPIQEIGGGARPQRVIKAPKTGTIAVDNATPGQYVTAGARLATAYDDVYVTARVPEEEIGGVCEGSLVDITAIRRSCPRRRRAQLTAQARRTRRPQLEDGE
jgi:hypothetical protein